MFIQIAELKSAIYQYQVQQITEADNDIIYMAITAAEDEAKSYLRPNGKKEWQDGRKRYDVTLIFGAVGNARNPLLLEMTKSIAVWYLMRLCNVDMIFDNAKERYDRAIAWLKDVSRGNLTLDLPVLADLPVNNPNAPLPFRSGSRVKFNHE
jgi:hypothetical protein